MFDANAAHMPCGVLFFTEVLSTNKTLESWGLSVGDIILCSHITKNKGSICYQPKETEIQLSLCNKKVYNDEESDKGGKPTSWSWLKYSGRPDGSGFIDDRWKAKALEFLGGEWDK